MRTTIFLIASFILIFIISNCNFIVDPPTEKINPIEPAKTEKKPCCNTGRFISCDPPVIMGLNTECGEIDITCECCNEIYQYYGNPDNLLGINIPCNLVGYEVCIPNEE